MVGVGRRRVENLRSFPTAIMENVLAIMADAMGSDKSSCSPVNTPSVFPLNRAARLSADVSGRLAGKACDIARPPAPANSAPAPHKKERRLMHVVGGAWLFHS